MFMMPENLYRFLLSQPTDTPVYFGAQYQYPITGTPAVIYCSGGSGYGLNRKALEILLERNCRNYDGMEDVTIGASRGCEQHD